MSGVERELPTAEAEPVLSALAVAAILDYLRDEIGFGSFARDLATHITAQARRVAELEQVLRVCRATLPHMGGNPMSTHTLCADIDAALKGQG